VKDAWIAAHRDRFALNARCDVRDVRVGGYRAWPGGGTADRRGLTEAPWLALIRAIPAERKVNYGRPRRGGLSGAHGAARRARHGWRA
jgi:hypothetical protein